MCEETFSMLNPKRMLELSNVSLCSPGAWIRVHGKVLGSTTYKGSVYTFPVYVIHRQNVNDLLSRAIGTG